MRRETLSMAYPALVAVYDNLDHALDDLTALEILHEDHLIDGFDAAVLDQESGRLHIVKRVDRPRIRVIGEELGSGALSRRQLEAAARELGPGQACLIAVGDSSLAKAFARLARATERGHCPVDTGAGEIAGAVHEALES